MAELTIAFEPFAKELFAFVSEAAPADYPLPYDKDGLSFLTVREGETLKGAVAMRWEDRAVNIIGMRMDGAAGTLPRAFQAVEDRLVKHGGGRVSFMAETDGVANFAERMGMKLRAVYYVKDF